MNDTSEVLSGGLMRLLAGNFALLFKARYLSWQETAEQQGDLRAVVRQDHRDLNESVDALARMIVGLGRRIPPSYPELVQGSSFSEKLLATSVHEMICEIAEDHRQAITDIDLLMAVLPSNINVGELLRNLRVCHTTSLQSLSLVLASDRDTLPN